MQIQKFNWEDKEIVQIYMKNEEQCNMEIKEKTNADCIFINGKNNTVKTIKEMLEYEKSKEMK